MSKLAKPKSVQKEKKKVIWKEGDEKWDLCMLSVNVYLRQILKSALKEAQM